MLVSQQREREKGGKQGRRTHPKRSKRIRSHLKAAPIDPLKKAPEYPRAALLPVPINLRHAPRTAPLLVAVIVQNHGRGRLAALDELLQDGPRVLRALFVVVPLAQLDQDLRTSFDYVGEGERFGARRGVGRAEAEDVGENDLGVFARVEGEAVEVDGEEIQEVFFDHARY